MKVLKGFLIVIVSILPWAWVFIFNYFFTPTFGIGSLPGKISVIAVAAIVLALGIRAMLKGYGRQVPRNKTE